MTLPEAGKALSSTVDALKGNPSCLAAVILTAILAMQLITVHMIDGLPVLINPQAITRMVDDRAKDDPRRQFPHKVECVIYFTDGSYLSVAETCSEIRKQMG